MSTALSVSAMPFGNFDAFKSWITDFNLHLKFIQHASEQNFEHIFSVDICNTRKLLKKRLCSIVDQSHYLSNQNETDNISFAASNHAGARKKETV